MPTRAGLGGYVSDETEGQDTGVELVAGGVVGAEPEGSAGASMEIHKPKAAHSFREFLTEIGTIMCGILIALGLEQAVEWSHWQERLRQTREQVNTEISSDVEAATLWLSAAPCLDKSLSKIEQGLWSARQSGRYAGSDRFSPPLVRFQSEAWLSARSLQVFDRFSTEEVGNLASFYFFPTEMITSVVTLHSQAGELEVLAHPLDHLQPAEVDELLARVGRTKELFTRMNYASMLVVRSGQQLHAIAPPTYTQQQLARGLHQPEGCLSNPARVWALMKVDPHEGDPWAALGLHYRHY